MSDLSPMAQEMKKAVLELPGLKPADIDRVLAILTSCEAIMLEAMRDFVRERVRQQFGFVFAHGVLAGVSVSLGIIILARLLT